MGALAPMAPTVWPSLVVGAILGAEYSIGLKCFVPAATSLYESQSRSNIVQTPYKQLCVPIWGKNVPFLSETECFLPNNPL